MDHLQLCHMPRRRRPDQDIWTERRTRVSPATTATDHRTTSSAASAQSGSVTRSCVEVTQFVFHFVSGSLLWFTTSQIVHKSVYQGLVCMGLGVWEGSEKRTNI